MRCLSFALLLALGAPVHAGSCEQMKGLYQSMPSHADELVAERSPFKVLPTMLGRGEFRACAIVSFQLDGQGGVRAMKLAAFHPHQGIGRAAEAALVHYRFVPGDYQGRRFVLLFEYNKLELP